MPSMGRCQRLLPMMMQKLVISQVVEATGLAQAQTLATLFDGIARHSLEGMNFKARAEDVGWLNAVADRDQGTFDWTQNQSIDRKTE